MAYSENFISHRMYKRVAHVCVQIRLREFDFCHKLHQSFGASAAAPAADSVEKKPNQKAKIQ